MPLIATKGNASSFAYGLTGGAPEVLGGMVLITPTSVDKTGTGSTATIGTNGSVEFSSCATLSLNGVFTADYDNYILNAKLTTSSTLSMVLRGRLRSSGTDSTATTDYNSQIMSADGTSASTLRLTDGGYWTISMVGSSSSHRDGITAHIFGPYLSAPTAYTTVTASAASSARIYDCAGTHELSTSYDGITIYIPNIELTGLVSVYGLVGA